MRKEKGHTPPFLPLSSACTSTSISISISISISAFLSFARTSYPQRDQLQPTEDAFFITYGNQLLYSKSGSDKFFKQLFADSETPGKNVDLLMNEAKVEIEDMTDRIRRVQKRIEEVKTKSDQTRLRQYLREEELAADTERSSKMMTRLTAAGKNVQKIGSTANSLEDTIERFTTTANELKTKRAEVIGEIKARQEIPKPRKTAAVILYEARLEIGSMGSEMLRLLEKRMEDVKKKSDAETLGQYLKEEESSAIKLREKVEEVMASLSQAGERDGVERLKEKLRSNAKLVEEKRGEVIGEIKERLKKNKE